MQPRLLLIAGADAGIECNHTLSLVSQVAKTRNKKGRWVWKVLGAGVAAAATLHLVDAGLHPKPQKEIVEVRSHQHLAQSQAPPRISLIRKLTDHMPAGPVAEKFRP